MNKNIVYFFLIFSSCYLLTGCGGIKRVFKNNYAFKYEDNQTKRVKDSSIDDKLYVYQIESSFKSKIDDKTDYSIIKTDSVFKHFTPTDTIPVKPPKPEKIQISGTIYSTENSFRELDQFQRSFVYSDCKFALQTLTIPLKFRKALDDGTKFPNQVESGVNIGFAPVVKYSINVFNPGKKIMGKSTNQYSINSGLILNLGATDLKTTTTAPGLKSDRKSPMFTFGTFIMIGINNINFGYAIGIDKIIGEGHSYWVYQDKIWTGLIIALDIIKP
jgi:hypothetical protein